MAIPTPAIDCCPQAPSLEWYQTNDGGAFYPRQSHINLQLYIEALDNCITDHQAP
ncbi:hypothetical protein GCM10023333_12520 [Ferrimonas pelagia]|uniref:Uncharacterized protein n=1 Tax=Ferrimonas pelagia TaxID=1177826 RepID=A0ABP9EIH5_9GAMM